MCFDYAIRALPVFIIFSAGECFLWSSCFFICFKIVFIALYMDTIVPNKEKTDAFNVTRLYKECFQLCLL